MSEQEIKELEFWIHKNVFKADGLVGLKKRGLWYRPNACGYTDRQEEAGRYTLEEAKKHEHADDVPVTIHEFDVPRYASKPAPALEVLKRCAEKSKREDGLYNFICVRPLLTGVGFAVFRNVYGIGTDYAECPTLELAICQFAKQLFTKL